MITEPSLNSNHFFEHIISGITRLFAYKNSTSDNSHISEKNLIASECRLTDTEGIIFQSFFAISMSTVFIIKSIIKGRKIFTWSLLKDYMVQYIVISMSLTLNEILALFLTNQAGGNECDWYLSIFIPDWIVLFSITRILNIRLEDIFTKKVNIFLLIYLG